jgi:hypothetical protein
MPKPKNVLYGAEDKAAKDRVALREALAKKHKARMDAYWKDEERFAYERLSPGAKSFLAAEKRLEEYEKRKKKK